MAVCGEDHHEGTLDGGAQLGAERMRDGATRESRRVTLVEVIEWKEHQRRTRACGEAIDRHAANCTACVTPGCWRPIVPICLVTSIVRSREAAGGSCRDRDDVLLVLRRDEAAGQGGESQVGKHDQAPVDGKRNAAAAHGVTTARE